MSSTEPPMGLRERKKLATRRALSLAALHLVVRRGLDNVLVEDIADAAGVSPRTFNNYFGSKLEAICAHHGDRNARLVAALEARPADEPLWDSLRHVLTEPFQGAETGDQDWKAGVRLMVAIPELTAEMGRLNFLIQRALTDTIAARLGRHPHRDPYPALVAGAVVGVTTAVLDLWMHSPDNTSISALLADALDRLAVGLPEPPRSTP